MTRETDGELTQTQSTRRVGGGSDIEWENARAGTRLLLAAVGATPDRVEETSKRRVPQTLETLTSDIAAGLRDEVDAKGVVVGTTATHLCEAMRGVEQRTETTTRAMSGDIGASVAAQLERAVDRSTRK